MTTKIKKIHFSNININLAAQGLSRVFGSVGDNDRAINDWLHERSDIVALEIATVIARSQLREQYYYLRDGDVTFEHDFFKIVTPSQGREVIFQRFCESYDVVIEFGSNGSETAANECLNCMRKAHETTCFEKSMKVSIEYTD